MNHTRTQKIQKRFGIKTTFATEMYQLCWGIINNPPAIQFSYKFEFILSKNWGNSYKDIKTLNC